MKALVLVFVASCGFPEPLGPPVDLDAGDPADPDLALADGTISTGGGAFEAGALTVHTDGFETFERFCAGTLCVTGGVTP